MPAQYPSSLGTVDEFFRRLSTAKSRRQKWDTDFWEAYFLALPMRETIYFHDKGQDKNRQVYDSTAIQAVQAFTSRLQSALTPPWKTWARFESSKEVPEAQRQKLNAVLEHHTNTLFDYIDQSNLYTQLNESYSDLSVSTGALILEEGNPLAGEPLLKFTNIPLAELYMEEGPNATVDTAFRCYKMPARTLGRVWPLKEPSQQLQDLMRDRPNDEVAIVDAMVFEPNESVTWQIVLVQKTKEIIFTQKFTHSPHIIFRWSVTPGEIYGRGPVLNAMPDIRTVNKVKEMILKNASLAISGAYTAVDDGIINPYNVRIAPGAIIPVANNSNLNPSLRPLERSGDFSVAEFVMQDLQANINRALFANPTGELSDSVRSATEQNIRFQEMLRQSGAAFARLKHELIFPLMRKSLAILQRRGKIPKTIQIGLKEVPFNLDNPLIRIRLTSPLATAEAMQRVNDLQTYIGLVGSFGPELIALTTKVKAMPRYLGEQLDIPLMLLNTPDEIEAIAAQMAEAQQQQQQAEAQQQGQPQ